MRAAYTVLAATLMTFAYLDALSPAPVFAIAALMGVLRTSDLVMRYALVAETMPPGILMSGMSISRTTTDSARVAGVLTGAGVVRLEERCVGKEWVGTCRSRWWPCHSKKHTLDEVYTQKHVHMNTMPLTHAYY